MSEINQEITPAQKQALLNIVENVKYGGTASTMITLLTNGQFLKCVGTGDVTNAQSLLAVQMDIVRKQRESFKAQQIPA